MIEAPYPELDELLALIGEAGQRLSEIDASEGAAGNISVCADWPIDPRRRFPLVETIPLPLPVPELAGSTFLVTGSGRRLREIVQDPAANLGCVVIDEGGESGRLYTSPRRLFANLTSEFNSHLAVHYDQVVASGTNFHAVIHAQPPYLTYLSHIPRYQDTSLIVVIWQAGQVESIRWRKILANGVILALYLFYLPQTYQYLLVSYREGSGLSGAAWKNSETMQVLRQFSPAGTLFSNNPTAIYFVLGRQAISIPEQYDRVIKKYRPEFEQNLAIMRQRLKEPDSALVILDP